MILKYDFEVDDKIAAARIKNLINQTYKLLPSREEGQDWKKPLNTILVELSGIQRLTEGGYSAVLLPVVNKLEGLYSLDQDDFYSYRRTIFECLSLMNVLEKKICPQRL